MNFTSLAYTPNMASAWYCAQFNDGRWIGVWGYTVTAFLLTLNQRLTNDCCRLLWRDGSHRHAPVPSPRHATFHAPPTGTLLPLPGDHIALCGRPAELPSQETSRLLPPSSSIFPRRLNYTSRARRNATRVRQATVSRADRFCTTGFTLCKPV